jgi:hypothetical protein
MYNQRNDKNNINAAERVSINDFLGSFYPCSSMPKVRHQGEAMIIRQQINTPNNPQFRNIETVDGRPRWGNQKIDYVKSNIKGDRGVIFYFRCLHCNRRAKYLYFMFHGYSNEPWCRICCNLHYNQPNRRHRLFSRLLNKQNLSTEAKHLLIKKANITKEDIDNYLSDNCKN